MPANRCYVLGGNATQIHGFIDDFFDPESTVELKAPKRVTDFDHDEGSRPAFVLLSDWTRNDDYTVPFIDTARRLMDKYDGSV